VDWILVAPNRRRRGALLNTVDADFIDWLGTNQLVKDSSARIALLTAKNAISNFMWYTMEHEVRRI
jgi:hypothetical protein